jgi:hypothetical protein
VITTLKNIPSADAVFNDLVPVLTASYDAFEQATFEARDYFERKKKEIDPYLFAHLARYNALEVLKEKGHDIRSGDDEPGWKLKTLANSGIYLAYYQYRVRILKFKRKVPHPGHSQSRQRYYEQDWEQMRFDWPLLDDSQDYLNMLLLWKVDDNYGLTSFSLACPQGAGTTRDSVSLYWNKVVPMEYLQNILIAPTPEPAAEPLDLPVEENVEIEIDRDCEE